MKRDRFLPLATVRKTYGKEGELFLKFHPKAPQTFLEQWTEDEPVYIHVDGIPVPFYITSLQFVGNDKAVVCFENYPTERLAAEWVGSTLLVKVETAADEVNGSRLVGYAFRAKTEKEGMRKGIVSQFFDYPMNPCLELTFEDGTSILLPFHPTFVIKTNHRNKSLELLLPEGLE